VTMQYIGTETKGFLLVSTYNPIPIS